MRSIAQRLGHEDWPLIDLTLKQFQMSWTDQWQGTERSDYVIDMISGAEDQTLVDLAKHLGVVTELESIESPSFWTPNQPRIFISHLAAVKKNAGALKVALEQYGCVCFVAHDDIEPTKVWQREIEAALTTMDAMIAILTPGFNESKWTDQEVGVAIGRRVPVVPLKAGIDPYGFIGKYQALPASGRTAEDIAVDIIGLLAGKPQLAFKISNGLVHVLEQSSSWAESKKLMDLVEKCRQFAPEALERLEEAAEKNSQVREAWGVPERIKRVVAQAGR